MTDNPEQLFELFYKNVRDDMCPPGLCISSYRSNWWRERFMNAYYGIKEPRELMSWAEAPQMWLAAYREFSKTPTIIYEIGMFEQYESGFHAFYRTSSAAEAQRVKKIAERLQPITSVFYSFEETENFEFTKQTADELFKIKTGKSVPIGLFPKDMYEIQIREVEIDR